MKKAITLSLAAVITLGGCDTYQGTGAFAGASLGSILGSAVGGIAGGPRGSDIGTIVGMAGGAAVGAGLGAQADKARSRSYDSHDGERPTYRHSRENDYDNGRNYDNDRSHDENDGDDSGFDPTNSGDDTLYDFNGPDYTDDYTASRPETVTTHEAVGNLSSSAAPISMPLEIRNVRFVDDNRNHTLDGGELCKVIFEVYNVSGAMAYDVQPTVVESTGNKRISISSTVHVERIAPGKGIRYTAMVLASKRVKDGNACFRIYAVQGNGDVASGVSELTVPTRRM